MIREITVPVQLLEMAGLSSPATLRGLGRTVLLAGANGSGKTRFLRAIGASIEKAGEWATNRLDWEGNVGQWEEALLDPNRPDGSKHSIRDVLAKRDADRGILVDRDTGLGRLPGGRRVIWLTYDLRKDIEDAAGITQRQLQSAVASTATAGFATAYTKAHSYLTVVAQRLFAAGHKDFQDREEMRAQKEDADHFNLIVNSLLGTEIEWSPQAETAFPIPLVMGRSFRAEELSSGQKILLAWSIILHRQRQHLGNAIVFIDEPENHLHPDVCIRALDKLQNEVLGEKGQIWLATHSIPLIAWAGFDAIHFVHDGRIEYAGNRVDEVVDGLVGGEEGRERLRTFLADAEDLALYKFAGECLTAPAVAQARGADPQEAIFSRLVSERARSIRPLRILDFGAGHGRLAAALLGARREGSSVGNLPPVHYFAYDRGEPCDIMCHQHLTALTGEAGVAGAYVEDLRTLRGRNDHVDVAVLCNVLHEIAVTDWFKTFADLESVLTDDGCVILMEDQTPSVGELPNRSGFVILDEVESKRLFGDDDGVRPMRGVVNPAWSQRLTVMEIPKSALKKATPETVRDALRDVRERAESEIRKLRAGAGEAGAFRRGRLTALFAMQWVNAELAQRAFGGG